MDSTDNLLDDISSDEDDREKSKKQKGGQRKVLDKDEGQ